MSEVTRILSSLSAGKSQAAEELLPLVYEELRRLAAAKLAREAPGQTLQPTALVHEAYLKLLGSESQDWKGRAHFFSAAAEAMRRILIDKARQKQRRRHGGGQQRVSLDRVDIAVDTDDETLLLVNEALEVLETRDPVKAQLVKLRFFAGLTVPEAGRVLGLSETTTKRYWSYARAWLYERLKSSIS